MLIKRAFASLLLLSWLFVSWLFVSSVVSTAAEPAPLMKVLIKPGVMSDVAGKGVVEVTMTIPAMEVAAGAPLLSLQTMVPGASKAVEVADLVVSDARGPVPLESQGNGLRKWTSKRAVKGDLAVNYRVPIENSPRTQGGPQTYPRVDGDGFSSVGNMFLLSPQTKGTYRVAIDWDLSAMGPGAVGVSSYGDGNVVLPAGPVERVNRSLFIAGHLQREPRQPVTNGFSSVWLREPPFDPRPAMQWTGKLHAWMSGFFRDKTEPPYRVFLRFNAMNAGSGAALINSFIVTYGAGITGENLKRILGHEMTHTWTANSLGRWYDEGNAVYYQALLAWRAGIITADDYLNDINLTASRYYTNLMRDTPEDQVDARFWEDTRVRVLPYDRGAIYFAVLNGKIRKASGGRRSMDDLIRKMIERYHAGEPISEAVWLDLLRKETGEDGPAVHRSMMAGGLMLPESEDYGPCFRRVTRKIPRFDIGFDMKSMVATEKTIHGLQPDSAAAKAGVREGDKFNYAATLDTVQGDVRQTLTLQVTRDGKTFPITYLPRGEAVDAYQWERIRGASEEGCKVRLGW